MLFLNSSSLITGLSLSISFWISREYSIVDLPLILSTLPEIMILPSKEYHLRFLKVTISLYRKTFITVSLKGKTSMYAISFSVQKIRGGFTRFLPEENQKGLKDLPFFNSNPISLSFDFKVLIGLLGKEYEGIMFCSPNYINLF
jgi:hypothetical protein